MVVALFSFIVFIIFVVKWLSRTTLFPPPRKNVPPSPRKLPVIGNLHQLGSSPHRSMHALSKLHGKHLLLLHLGRLQVLVASSAQAARELMKKQDFIFSNRPKSRIADKLFYGCNDVAFAPLGERWKKARSIEVTHLLSNKRVHSFSRIREEETSAMVEKIKQLIMRTSASRAFNLSDVLMSLTNNVICRVTLGKCGEDQNFNKLVKDLVAVLGVTESYGDYIPCLGWIIDRFNGLDAKVERLGKDFDVVLENAMRERRDGTIRHGDGDLDFLDILLQFQRDDQSSSPLNDDTIKGIVMNVFGAGINTTSVTLDWTIAELIKNPRTMKKLQKQVRQAAGAKKEINEDDVANMPYLKAVIKESLRLHAPVPLLLPRESTRDTRVMGYDISAGTRVLINAWAIGRDPSLWENPEEFRPERFLDSNNVDYKGLNFELIPFGAGRRGCPGIAFAEGVVELGLAKLVHYFDFDVGVKGEDLDMSESIGMTVHKKQPLLVVATPFI